MKVSLAIKVFYYIDIVISKIKKHEGAPLTPAVGQ